MPLALYYPSCPYSPSCLEVEFCELRDLGILGSSVALAAFATMGAGAPVGSAGKGGSGDETLHHVGDDSPDRGSGGNTVAASERARSPGSEQGNGGYENVRAR